MLELDGFSGLPKQGRFSGQMFEPLYTVKVGDSPRSILAALGQDWDADKWRELMHFNRVWVFELAVFGVPSV